MIALSQARHSEQARAYLTDRRMSERGTRREALRAQRGFLVPGDLTVMAGVRSYDEGPAQLVAV
jgi:hypothetical protein